MIPSARTNDDKERVRDASDIVRIIGEHLSLKAKGREYACLCPFHDDHKPSMMVVPHKQIFHCFVCGVGGDVFSFVQRYHKMEFREALEYLAERAGIELTPRATGGLSAEGTPASAAGPTSRADLVRANASAADFFRTVLRHPEHGKAARDVIERRAISPEMTEQFALGASPDRWDGLLLTVQKLGASPGLFAEAGLLKRREQSSGLYDAFRNRLMFPIQDQIGRVIAFGARKIDEADEPKYLNSPETRIFEKAGTLYGLFQASRAIQAQRLAIITEGYTDTIACHQAGIANTVATLGTALTPRHAAVLRRLCDTVVLLFDGDDAGHRAADRAVEVFFSEDLDVKIATLSSVTDAKDPDELLKREGGRDLLLKAVAAAHDVLSYRYARIRERLAGAGLAAITRAVQEDVARLAQLGFNHIFVTRRRAIVKQLSVITGAKESDIWAAIPGGRPSSDKETIAPVRRPDFTLRDQALGCLLCEPSLLSDLSDAHSEALDPAHVDGGPLREIWETLFELAAADPSWRLEDLLSRLDDPAKSAATDLFMRISAITEQDLPRVRTFLNDCLSTLVRDEQPCALEFVRSSRSSGPPNRRVIPRPAG